MKICDKCRDKVPAVTAVFIESEGTEYHVCQRHKDELEAFFLEVEKKRRTIWSKNPGNTPEK